MSYNFEFEFNNLRNLSSNKKYRNEYQRPEEQFIEFIVDG